MTVSTIWKKKQYSMLLRIVAIMKATEKIWKSDLDEALLIWFKQRRTENMPINGPILKAKAEKMAKLFGYKVYVCSNGWIDRFKTRHNITLGKISGEASDVKTETNSYSKLFSERYKNYIKILWTQTIRHYNIKSGFQNWREHWEMFFKWKKDTKKITDFM